MLFCILQQGDDKNHTEERTMQHLIIYVRDSLRDLARFFLFKQENVLRFN